MNSLKGANSPRLKMKQEVIILKRSHKSGLKRQIELLRKNKSLKNFEYIEKKIDNKQLIDTK